MLMLPSTSKLTATSAVLSHARRASRRVAVGASERANVKYWARREDLCWSVHVLLDRRDPCSAAPVDQATHGLRRRECVFIALFGGRVVRGGRTVRRPPRRGVDHRWAKGGVSAGAGVVSEVVNEEEGGCQFGEELCPAKFALKCEQ